MQMGPARSGINVAIDAMPDKEARILSRRLSELRANMEATLHGIDPWPSADLVPAGSRGVNARTRRQPLASQAERPARQRAAQQAEAGAADHVEWQVRG